MQATDGSRSLNVLFQRNLARALEIVDAGGVECFVGRNSKRRVFQVRGKSAADCYTVFPSHYCSCHAFFYEVCKHQLAARLADVLKRCNITVVEDTRVAELMIQS
eukprot:evm.model.scf_450.6 EVM.evm.TU.scf_450.6   scf_450:67200-68896(+)